MTNLFIDGSPLVDAHPSGVGHSVAGLTGGLLKIAEKSHLNVVLLVPKKNSYRIQQWPELADIKVKYFPFRVRIMNALNRKNLLPPLDFFYGKGIYLFANFRNFPLTKKSQSITYIHDICYALYPKFVDTKNQQMLIKYVPGFLKRTNRVITVSESSKNEIINYYKLSSNFVDVIYNGVNADLYKQYNKKCTNVLRYELGVREKYFVYVGNIEPRKNLITLLKAYKSLSENEKNLTSLLIIGSDGWLNFEVIELISIMQNEGMSVIRPKRYISDIEVATLMGEAISLVQPSLHEGFSMPPVEAIAAGAPVIASDIPVHREILKDNALFFNPKSSQELAAVLSKVIHDKTRIRPKSQIVKEYSWDNAAEKMVTIINEFNASPRKVTK